MHIQMAHFELNPESGKVVQPRKQTGVDDVADDHQRQSQLNEVAEQIEQKEVRQPDIAANSGTGSDRVKTR